MIDRIVTRPSDGRTNQAHALARPALDTSSQAAVVVGRAAAARLAVAEAPILAPEPPTACPDRPAPRSWLHNLPQPLTSFIGRQREIAETVRLLGTTRLLTLTGTAGVGKTRLGHEVAASLLDTYPGGVWLVELAALVDPTAVDQAVASALGVREEPERPLIVSVAETISSQRALLILDNCEHLVEACATIADALLRDCPELHILATSRQPLGMAGETTFRVPSLAVAPSQRGPQDTQSGPDRLPEPPIGAPSAPRPIVPCVESEAICLFVERARAVVPSFRLTDRNQPSVEAICRHLDGIPLAIELAASRVAVLNPDQIAGRLGDRFRLLSGGSRTALPRYRTLRALLDWSHDLLDEREQVLLRRLAVFAGGWTLEAAEAVCAGGEIESYGVLDLLCGLVAKSLVLTVDHDGEVRYRFLESVRAYAAEKLSTADEDTTYRERHVEWLLDLSERAEPELAGPRQAAWLHQLDEEHDNLRAALAWSADRGGTEGGVRIAAALYRFWSTRGCCGEGRRWLTELLTRSAAHPCTPAIARARAKALRTAGRLAACVGDLGAAHDFLTEGLDVARQHVDRPGLADAAFCLGFVARLRGDYAQARLLYLEALGLFRALGDSSRAAECVVSLGVIAFFQRDLTAARSFYEQGLASHRALGDLQGVAVSLNNLGEIDLEEGDLSTACRLEQESLAISHEIGDVERVVFALAALAGVAAARGEVRRALRLGAAATVLRDSIGEPFSDAWRSRFESWLAPARQALTADEAAAAWAEGRAMTPEQAIDEAMRPAGAAEPPATTTATVATTPTTVAASSMGTTSRVDPSGTIVAAPPPPPAPIPAPAPVAASRTAPAAHQTPLTQREREVAGLVARGMSNRQIAAELVITEGTAANHVKHILARLVLDSRVQIATWAIERDLHRTATA